MTAPNCEKNSSGIIGNAAVDGLIALDPDFAMIVRRWGYPPDWSRPPGFATLVRIILEQQVSLASAKAAFDKLISALPQMTPTAFLTMGDGDLLQCGFSKQKTRYCRALATALVEGALDLDSLERLDDAAAGERLCQMKGIGTWTSDIYLLMALGRGDIFPLGDLALIKAARALKDLPENPSRETLRELAWGWRPFRSAAARLLWHFYLSGGISPRNRVASGST